MAAKKKPASKRRQAKPTIQTSTGLRLVLSTSLRGALNMAVVVTTSGIVLLCMFAAKKFL